MKKEKHIGELINKLQKNSKVGWGNVHITWESDGEFREGWSVNFDNRDYEAEELYDALLEATKSIKT